VLVLTFKSVYLDGTERLTSINILKRRRESTRFLRREVNKLFDVLKCSCVLVVFCLVDISGYTSVALKRKSSVLSTYVRHKRC